MEILSAVGGEIAAKWWRQPYRQSMHTGWNTEKRTIPVVGKPQDAMQYARSLEQLLEGILVVTSIEKANRPPGWSSANADIDTSWEGLETSTSRGAGARRWRLVYVNGRRQGQTVQSRRYATALSHVVEMSQCRISFLACLYWPCMHVSNIFLPILINPSFHNYVPPFLHIHDALDGNKWSASEVRMHARKMDDGVEVSEA